MDILHVMSVECVWFLCTTQIKFPLGCGAVHRLNVVTAVVHKHERIYLNADSFSLSSCVQTCVEVQILSWNSPGEWEKANVHKLLRTFSRTRPTEPMWEYMAVGLLMATNTNSAFHTGIIVMSGLLLLYPDASVYAGFFSSSFLSLLRHV